MYLLMISCEVYALLAVVKVMIIAIITCVWAFCLVEAQEKVCSSLCSTVGMLQSTPGKSCNDIYEFNKAIRKDLVTIGSTLLLVYTRCIVIRN